MNYSSGTPARDNVTPERDSFCLFIHWLACSGLGLGLIHCEFRVEPFRGRVNEAEDCLVSPA